jgi:Mg-chelatase subunit ChlI
MDMKGNELKGYLNNGAWFQTVEFLMGVGVIPDKVHRILLYGPPGTGKTTCPHKLLEEKLGVTVENVTLHPQFPPDDLIGSMGLVERNGATVTVWQDGPAIRAMRNGSCLVINEISRRSPEVEAALYNILDDLSICRVTLPTGEIVAPKKGFTVFGTTNDNPDSLPEAIQERFELPLLCRDPAPGILQALPAKQAKLVAGHYSKLKCAQWIPGVSVRSIQTAERIKEVVGEDLAYQIKFGKKGVDVLAQAAAM